MTIGLAPGLMVQAALLDHCIFYKNKSETHYRGEGLLLFARKEETLSQVRNMSGQIRNMSGQVRNMSGQVRNMYRTCQV